MIFPSPQGEGRAPLCGARERSAKHHRDPSARYGRVRELQLGRVMRGNRFRLARENSTQHQMPAPRDDTRQVGRHRDQCLAKDVGDDQIEFSSHRSDRSRRECDALRHLVEFRVLARILQSERIIVDRDNLWAPEASPSQSRGSLSPSRRRLLAQSYDERRDHRSRAARHWSSDDAPFQMLVPATR